MSEEVKHTVGLRPCPFCGDDEFLILANTLLGDHSYWGVECGCHVYGPTAILREDAIAAWNTRAAEAKSAVRAEIIDQLEKGLAVDGVEWVSTRTLDKMQARIEELEAGLSGLLKWANNVCRARGIATGQLAVERARATLSNIGSSNDG